MGGISVPYEVVAINGSPRVGGNTQLALNQVAEPLAAAGIRVEHIQIGNMRLWGCQACMACARTKDGRCAYGNDDGLNDILRKVYAADGLIVGSPTYFGGLTAPTKAFIDRCGYVCRTSDPKHMRGKVGAAVAIHRRAGANTVYQAINMLFGIMEMPIASSSYWPMAVARAPGEFAQDEEGARTMSTLGENMAEMIRKLRGERP